MNSLIFSSIIEPWCFIKITINHFNFRSPPNISPTSVSTLFKLSIFCKCYPMWYFINLLLQSCFNFGVMILGFVTVKFFPTLFFSGCPDYERLNLFITNTKGSFNILKFSTYYWPSYFIFQICIIWLNFRAVISSKHHFIIFHIRWESSIEIFLPILTQGQFSTH